MHLLKKHLLEICYVRGSCPGGHSSEQVLLRREGLTGNKLGSSGQTKAETVM